LRIARGADQGGKLSRVAYEGGQDRADRYAAIALHSGRCRRREWMIRSIRDDPHHNARQAVPRGHATSDVAFHVDRDRAGAPRLRLRRTRSDRNVASHNATNMRPWKSGAQLLNEARRSVEHDVAHHEFRV
jgi:hypothetical protein